MWNEEKHELITDEQYDGRKKRQALSVVLKKMLYYAITRQNLNKAAFMNDDARA